LDYEQALSPLEYRSDAYLEHEQAKAELKTLMPENAKEAIGHGVRAQRSKSGAVSFDLIAACAGASRGRRRFRRFRAL
jgi:hypothetical protein